MNTNDLVFYNKEGYRINTIINNNIQSADFYFDKNSSDTFKTQGLFTFEKIDGTTETFTNTNLIPYQIFNSKGITCYPSNSETLVIQDIKISVRSSNFFTKWFYIDGIEKIVEAGMYFKTNNLLATDPNFTNDEVYQILRVQKNRILVLTPLINNTSTITYVSGATITLLNVIETGYNFDINSGNAKYDFYTSKKRFSLISDDINAGTYTALKEPTIQTRLVYEFTDTIFGPITPAANDIIKIEFEFKSDKLVISNSQIEFVSISPTINYIIVPNIPKFLKVGNIISVIDDNNTILPGNNVNLMIESFDYTTNRIYVDQQVQAQLVNTQLVLADNKYTIEQEVVYDNNNNYSILVTYSAIVAKFQEILYETDNLINLKYNVENNSLVIYSDLNGEFYDLNISYKPFNLPIITPVVFGTYEDRYPIIVEEKLNEFSIIEPNYKYYTRNILFNMINNFLVVNINGKDYLEPFDIDIPTTLTNFVGTYLTELNNEFITISSNNDILTITTIYPNVPIYINIGNSSEYYILLEEHTLNSIKSTLTITINGRSYSTTFDTDDITTINNWVNTYYDQLEQTGIIVNNTLNVMYFSTTIIDLNVSISFNLGYIPKDGDKSVQSISYISDASYDLLSGNIIELIGYNALESFSVGQSISLSGSDKLLMNTNYTIIEIEPSYITLSYQGAFGYDLSKDIRIVSDDYIRFPQFGLSTSGKSGKFVWSWKDTLTPDIFMYDFSGDQLKPFEPGFPDYKGIKPLCGDNGEISLKLIKEPNMSINELYNPQKQQTIFPVIENILPWTDETSVDNILPNPLQIFVGYNSKYEMYNKARLYLEFIEEVKTEIINLNQVYEIVTSTIIPTTIENQVKLSGNELEVTNISMSLDFTKEYYPGQLIQLSFDDITPDNYKLLNFNNTGTLTIKYVHPHKLIFEETLIPEMSVQAMDKQSYPNTDAFGNIVQIWRYASVTITVLPKPLAEFNFYGETETEETRFNVHLNNINKDVLTMKDFFIFKETDINEEGIDWIYLNRKRKELLEIYGEIFNYVSSYKAIVKAINFFGYNDLSFNEYFQNIDPENKKFGQIFNLELLNILDKNTKSIKYDNLAISNLRNNGYIKTNLFSLGYKVTDDDGNFINAYSPREVKIKLLGLKRWLHTHLVPLGSKISDINAKYRIKSNFQLNHETYKIKNYKVEEYSTGIYHDIKIFKNIVTTGSNTYDVSIEFKTKDEYADDIFFSYDIKTYNVEIWNNVNYNANSYVLYNGKYYKTDIATVPDEEPVISNIWYEVKLKDIPFIQRFRDSKINFDNVSFTISELLDPMFEITVNWHSGYACTYSYNRTYHSTVYNEPATIIY